MNRLSRLASKSTWCPSPETLAMREREGGNREKERGRKR